MIAANENHEPSSAAEYVWIVPQRPELTDVSAAVRELGEETVHYRICDGMMYIKAKDDGTRFDLYKIFATRPDLIAKVSVDDTCIAKVLN